MQTGFSIIARAAAGAALRTPLLLLGLLGAASMPSGEAQAQFGLSLPGSPFGPAEAEPAPEPVPPAAMGDEELARLQSALAQLSAYASLRQDADLSLFDVGSLVERLGGQQEALFAFVRDQIRYEPYLGALRGAQGTLIGRAGNALDRSLLLTAMLTEAGYEATIATGTLDQTTAERLAMRAL